MSEELSRTSRRREAEKKKPKKAKKAPFIITLLLIVTASAGSLYWFINKEEAKKVFQEKQLALTEKVQSEMKESATPLKETITESDDFKKLVYLPTDEASFDPQLTEEVLDLVAQEEKKWEGEKGTIVGNIQLHPITDQLSSIQPLVTCYLWDDNKREFVEKKNKNEKITYLNQTTRKPLMIKDLFPEESNLLGLDHLIQQKLLDDSEDGKKIIDDVLNFPRLTWENFTFIYGVDSFTIQLPDNNLQVKELTFPLTEVGNYISEEFVDPTKIEDKKLTLDPNKKYIALTFDDGPGAKTTQQLLKTLKEKEVKTTFFNLGENATQYPDIVKQIVEDGHEIANHSFSHPPLNTLSKEAVEKEIRDTNKAIYLATGKLPKKVRPPYGAIDYQSADIAGVPILQWNIDSNDWGLKNANLIKKNVVDNAFNGGIILLHDIHQFSVDAVPGIIDELKEKGYTFITLDEMLGNTMPLYQYFGLYQGKIDARLIK